MLPRSPRSEGYRFFASTRTSNVSAAFFMTMYSSLMILPGSRTRVILSIFGVPVRLTCRRQDHGIPVAYLSLGSRLGKDDVSGHGGSLPGIRTTPRRTLGKGQVSGREPVDADHNGDDGARARRQTGGHRWPIRGNQGATGRLFSG